MTEQQRLHHLLDRMRRGVLLPAEGEALAELVAKLETDHAGLLKATASLITSIGYARHTLADNILGQVRAPDDVSLEQITVAVIAEYRADQSTIRRLTAGQCTHYKGTHDLHHTVPVTGCVWCTKPQPTV